MQKMFSVLCRFLLRSAATNGLNDMSFFESQKMTCQFFFYVSDFINWSNDMTFSTTTKKQHVIFSQTATSYVPNDMLFFATRKMTRCLELSSSFKRVVLICFQLGFDSILYLTLFSHFGHQIQCYKT